MEFKLYLFPQHADILAQLLVKKTSRYTKQQIRVLLILITIFPISKKLFRS